MCLLQRDPISAANKLTVSTSGLRGEAHELAAAETEGEDPEAWMLMMFTQRR